MSPALEVDALLLGHQVGQHNEILLERPELGVGALHHGLHLGRGRLAIVK